MPSRSNRSVNPRVAWSITFFCGCSTNCRPHSWHLNRCLPLWMRTFLTVWEEAQMGQAGMEGEQPKTLLLHHYILITTHKGSVAAGRHYIFASRHCPCMKPASKTLTVMLSSLKNKWRLAYQCPSFKSLKQLFMQFLDGRVFDFPKLHSYG